MYNGNSEHILRNFITDPLFVTIIIFVTIKYSSLYPGDWNKTPLPTAELYVLSQVVHDIDNASDLLKNVYKAILPGKLF